MASGKTSFMSTDEMKSLILRHYQTINYIPDLNNWPYHEIVWSWWEALAHFGIRNTYERLEDVPEGLEHISIMGETKVNYIWVNDQYERLQEITKEDCEGIYGSRIPGTY